MKELGVGVIGTGWVSDEYFKAFSSNPHTQVVAICSRTREKAQSKAQERGLKDCAVFTDAEEMVRLPGIDIVCIATPNFLHARQAILAADYGKHIVIEKPIAIDWKDMIRMKEAVDRAGVTTIVSFVLRWNPLVRTSKKLVTDGALGRVFHAEVDYLHAVSSYSGEPPWWARKETGGSILQENGCHAVDALRWLVNDDAVQVAAFSGKFRPDFEQDTTITLIAKFKGGATGKICCSGDVVSPYAFNVSLYGNKGTLINNRLWSREQFPDQSDWITIPAQAPDSGDVAHHPFASEIDHFVDCILDGKGTIVDLDDAIKTFEMIEAADRSAAAGGMPVGIPFAQ